MRRLLPVFIFFLFCSPIIAQQWETVDSDPVSLSGARQVDIAIVMDGPSELLNKISEKTEKELTLLARDEFQVRFSRRPQFTGNWTIKGVQNALRSALEDPDSEIVYAVGVLATRIAADPALKLNKPVLGGMVLDADALGLPYDKAQGRSTKENFSFVVSPAQIERDFEAFKQMIPFREVDILIDEKIYTPYEPLFSEALTQKEEKFGFNGNIVLVEQEAQEALDRVRETTEAVYFTPAFQLSEGEKQKLIDGINQKKIPSFSLFGLRDVQRGVLAGLAGDNTLRISRRIALNLQQMMLGTPARDLPVYLKAETQLALNAETAVAIDFVPGFSILNRAEVLFPDAFVKGEYLSLESAMILAAKNNVDLAVERARTEGARQQQFQALSTLLPQAQSNIEFTHIDKERAVKSFSFEHRTTAGFQASQILFDDAVWTNFRASIRNYKGQVFEEESVLLDVIETAAKRYLDYLSAQSLLQVEIDNLKLTQSNLDLARVREQVGTAGPEEVYRWEAQEANQKASVNDAKRAFEQARVALNQSLGVDENRRWNAKDIYLADDDFYFLDNRISGYINNTRQLAVFRRFVVEEAYRNSPELKAIQKGIAAQKLILNQLKRRFVLPSASTILTYDNELEEKDFRTGIFAEPNHHDWFFGVTATYPLFEGGGRIADIKQAEAQLDELKQTYERARQLLAQRAQSSVYSVEASHPNIRLNRQAADRANKNLEVVQDKYAQGILPIIDLLDAQNQAFTQNQSAAIAVYEYLKDLIEFERSLSWFETTKNEEENFGFLERFKFFMEGSKDKIKDWI